MYKFGTLEEFADRFRSQNERYESRLYRLRNEKKHLTMDIREITESVKELGESNEKMIETTLEFEEIRERLSSLCNENEEMTQIEDLIDSLNRDFDAMRLSVLDKEKTTLLLIFYETCYRDDEIGLSRSEYQRFLALLTRDTRRWFEDRGTFEELAGGDSVIGVQEFQELVDSIVTENDEELMRNALRYWI